MEALQLHNKIQGAKHNVVMPLHAPCVNCERWASETGCMQHRQSGRSRHHTTTTTDAHLISTALSCHLCPNFFHQGLALGSAQGLEGGEGMGLVPMYSDQVHDVSHTQAWEDATAGRIVTY